MTEPWVPPSYIELNVRPGYIDTECGRCGVLVLNVIQHNRYHHALDQLRDSAVALTKLLVPDAPDGSLLTPVVVPGYTEGADTDDGGTSSTGRTEYGR